MTLFLDIGNSRLKWLLFASNNQNKILAVKKGSIYTSLLAQPKKTIEENLFFQQIIKNTNQIKKEFGNKYSFEHKNLKKVY